MSPRPASLPVIAAPLPRASARVGAVADMLDCDHSQIRRLVRDGALESFTIGKRGVRIYLDSVAAYQERQARPVTGRPAAEGKAREKAGRRRASTAAHASAMAELQALGVIL